MVNDHIFAQTKQVSFSTEENGSFVIIEPLDRALLITDILITWRHTLLEPEEGGTIELNNPIQLMLQIGDNDNRFELCDLETNNDTKFMYGFQGGFKFWKGGRLELFKNFNGKVTVVVGYNRLDGADYTTWQRSR